MVISMFHGEFKPLLSDGKPLGDFKDAIGFVGFTEYHNGVASNERSFSGHWVTEKESEFGTFTSAGSRLDPLSGATVDDSQIAISISYENINGGKTAYSLTARFSTLRVAETFSVKQEDGKTWGDTSSGKCIYFHSY